MPASGELRGLCDSTIEQELIYLNQVLRLARAVWGYSIPETISQYVRYALRAIGWSPKAKFAGRFLSDAEIAGVKACWRSDIPVETVDFALDTAMRASEIVRLRWQDYDPEAATIVIRDRKHPSEKRDNHQTVPLLGRARATIEAQPRGLLIFSFKQHSMTTAWQRARDRAGLKGLRFHDLRHTGISRLFAQGLRIEQVALISGQRDWAMLKRYTHVRAEDFARTV